MSPVPGLDAKVREVVEAAIAAEMMHLGYAGTCERGFVGYSLPTEEVPIAEEILVTYPDARVYLHRAPYDDLAEADDLRARVDAKGVYEKWASEITQNFERYEQLPDPGDFDAPIGTLAAAATGLAVGGVTLDGSGEKTRVSIGNLDLSTYVQAIQSEIAGYEGDAMETLNGSYLSRLDDVLSGQHALAAVLGTVLTGEREIWDRTRRDVLMIAEEARKAFAQLAGQGDGGPAPGLLEVAGAVASSAAVFSESIKVEIAAAAIDILGLFLPEPPPKPPPLKFSGGNVSEVHEHLLFALDELSRTVAAQEYALSDCVRLAGQSVTDHLDAYDFGTPGAFLGEGRQGQLFESGENVALLMPGLREIAGYVGAVSTVVDDVRGDLSGVTTPTPWERHPYVGTGRFGPHQEWQTLHGQLGNVMERSATSMRTVAERMVLVSYDFQRTDEQVDAELQRLIGQLPDPTPREKVPYGHP